MSINYVIPVKVLRVEQRHRTVSDGTKGDDGKAIMTDVSIGWFVTLDTGISLAIGDEAPEGIKAGERWEIVLRKAAV